jgi:hypothetical protein
MRLSEFFLSYRFTKRNSHLCQAQEKPDTGRNSHLFQAQEKPDLVEIPTYIRPRKSPTLVRERHLFLSSGVAHSVLKTVPPWLNTVRTIRHDKDTTRLRHGTWYVPCCVSCRVLIVFYYRAQHGTTHLGECTRYNTTWNTARYDTETRLSTIRLDATR